MLYKIDSATYNRCVLASGSAIAPGSTPSAVPNGSTTEYPFNETDETLYDPQSLHSISVNPTRITIKKPGIYMIWAMVWFPDNSTGDRLLNVTKNGTNIGGEVTSKDAGGRWRAGSTVSVYMDNGDYTSISLYQSTGSPITPNAVSFGIMKLDE